MIVEKAVRTSGYAYPLRLETAILREYVLEPAPAPQVQTEKLLQEAWRRAPCRRRCSRAGSMPHRRAC